MTEENLSMASNILSVTWNVWNERRLIGKSDFVMFKKSFSSSGPILRSMFVQFRDSLQERQAVKDLCGITQSISKPLRWMSSNSFFGRQISFLTTSAINCHGWFSSSDWILIINFQNVLGLVLHKPLFLSWSYSKNILSNLIAVVLKRQSLKLLTFCIADLFKDAGKWNVYCNYICKPK